MRPSPHATHVAALLCVVAVVLAPRSAASQEALPGLVGGSTGLLAGGFVSVGIWTAKARFGNDYLYDTRDALGWEATPVVAGAATGLALGLADPDRLRRAGVGAAAGLLLGTGVGMTLGVAHWELPEGRWAGGVIGGAAGLVVGTLVGALWPDDDPSPPDASAARSPGVPVGVTLRFR